MATYIWNLCVKDESPWISQQVHPDNDPEIRNFVPGPTTPEVLMLDRLVLHDLTYQSVNT